MTENENGPDRMAGILEAINQAKRQVVELREREVEAKKNCSEAQKMKRRRKKGGSEAVRTAEHELAEVGRLKSEVESMLKGLEREQLELEELVVGPRTDVDSSVGGGEHVDEEKEEPARQQKVANVATGDSSEHSHDVIMEEVNEKEEPARQQKEANSATGDSSGDPHDVVMDERGVEDHELKLITDGDRDQLMMAAAQATGRKRESVEGEIPEDHIGENNESGGVPVPERKKKKITYEDNKAKENARTTKKYKNGTEQEKRQMRRDVNHEIELYIRDPKRNGLSDTTRNLILTFPEVGRKAGSFSRQLALHCMVTNRGNIICPYHKEKDRQGLVQDTTVTEDSPYQVTGTPFDRVIDIKRDIERVQRKGVLDCGCTEDDVLLDFYWWKETTVTSVSTGATEGWKHQRLDPRARLLMKHEWEFISGLTVNDIYKRGMKHWEFEAQRCTVQIKVFQARLKEAKSELSKGSA